MSINRVIVSLPVTRGDFDYLPTKGLREIAPIPTMRHADDSVLGKSRRMVKLLLKRTGVK